MTVDSADQTGPATNAHRCTRDEDHDDEDDDDEDGRAFGSPGVAMGFC